jgi:serine/threonine-protein kinase RsbW
LSKSPDILVISSDKSELEKAKEFLRFFFKKYNLPEDNFNRIFLCLSEAVINSIQHGNQNDKKKQVSIQAKYYDNFVSFRISDEGDGFNFHNVEDPTQSRNLKKESGRGIHIIKSLSKELEFIEQGKCIQFKIECK